MDFKTIASHLWPYWTLGLCVVLAVIAAGQKQLLRFEKKPIVKWSIFLFFITALRFAFAKFFNFHGIGNQETTLYLPWYISLFVFWEDIAHALPLVIFKKLVNMKKWWIKLIYTFLLLLVSIEFGLGHAYQGLSAVVILSFYIPYSIRIGAKYGFGTMVLCHMMYDAATLLFIQYLLGQ